MKYYVRIGASPRIAEVVVEGGRVIVNGEPHAAQLAPVPGTQLYHLLLGGQSWTVAAQALTGVGDGGGPRWALGAVGERVEVEAVDERTRGIQALTSRREGRPGGGQVRAPMPGLVVRLEVQEGQRVAAGAPLIVVEAMKMENELRAQRAGRVSKIHVKPGAAVERGAILVTLTDTMSEPEA